MRNTLAIAGLALMFAIGTAHAADGGGSNSNRASSRHGTTSGVEKHLEKDRKDNDRSNKGGETRGQDRANQARDMNQQKKSQ